MRHNRLQNKVARSEATLPVCIATAAILWWLPRRDFYLPDVLGFGLCLLTAYVVMETNARQHLIRIRTRLMTCVWLVLSACFAFMHPLGRPMAVAALLATAYMLLFRCYQRKRPEAFAFHAFLMLGTGSFVAPVMLPMAVLFFFYLGILLRSLTWRSFWAGVLGLVAPYWCFAVWCFLTGNTGRLMPWLHGDTDRGLFFGYRLSAPMWMQPGGGLSLAEQFSAGLVALLGLVGIVHFLRTNFDDKIRVRMMLYIYMVQALLLTVFLILQPGSYETTMAMLVVSVCPLIAHFFSLSGSLLTTVFFLLTLLLTAAMSVLNLWTTSFSIS